MKLVLKNARLTDEQLFDIIIEGNRISKITKDYQGEGKAINLAGRYYVSSGWIDLHTHAFPKYKPYCANPDEIGYQTGVTTVVDAGSSGYEDINEFYELTRTCKTRVLSFLNVSRIGLKKIDELADLANLQFEPIKKAYQNYPNFIVGLKARMSASVVKGNGIKPLQIAKKFANKLDLPLMVHIGSEPPGIEEILDELEQGDIVTHCFNGKDNNIFRNQDQAVPQLQLALDRGVLLDIGHGTESFSFQTARKARRNQIRFNTISTDIYDKNKMEGPVYDMATTLTKLLYLDYCLEDIIKAVTEMPAKILKQEGLGKIEEGAIADLTIFEVQKKNITLIDSYGETVDFDKKIVPKSVVLGGEYIELK